MSESMNPAHGAEFPRPDGPIVAAVGGLIAGAALVGAGMAVFMMRDPDLRTLAILAFGTIGALLLGAGLLNAWRVPMLTILPDRVIVPTFFRRREIRLTPGGRIGELLATPMHGGSRPGDIVGNRFVHFFALDGTGEVVELLALHRATPTVAEIRRAFQDVAGLRVEELTRNPKARRPWPDVELWRREPP